MPLHLLGKKSWNVYNVDNIARVQRDEAEARAQEADVERRHRNSEGDARLAQLRGEKPSITEAPPRQLDNDEDGFRGHSRKKRRLAGEDDTERDIRLAGDVGHRNEVPLTDAKGHIDLLQHGHTDRAKDKTTSAPADNGMGVRLADAAGRGSQAGKAWYNAPSADSYISHTAGKNVWGKEDAGRQVREQRRMDVSDPLAAMKKGVRQLRQAEAQRKEWQAQRERDLTEVEELARKEQRHRRRKRDAEDSLDGFELDSGYVEKSASAETSRSCRKNPDRHSHRHHHRRRSRSRSPRLRKERRQSRDAPASIARVSR